MKIILSRKGFDSSFGGCASPIFEDGTILSLPIPEKSGRYRFDDIDGPHRVGAIVEDLTRHRKRPLRGADRVHLDPDLRFESVARKPGWLPLFGQAEVAQSHLDNHGIDLGDVFLFFGWFRRVEQHHGHYRFRTDAPDIHMIFGWLEVGEIWRLWKGPCEIPEWASEHPHACASYSRNTIYVASQGSNGYNAGVFTSYSDDLVLTAPGKTRSHWRLPKWFHPDGKSSSMSYHRAPHRWTLNDHHVDLKTVGRGQEFVLDSTDYPEAAAWVRSLMAKEAPAQRLGGLK